MNVYVVKLTFGTSKGELNTFVIAMNCYNLLNKKRTNSDVYSIFSVIERFRGFAACQ